MVSGTDYRDNGDAQNAGVEVMLRVRAECYTSRQF